ncbi:MAG TPA: carbamoyltransferase N-terminal domain-containing protein [Pyrinomonadaceae bacterium]|nr:carbamoyltransferase N-terminal domain-containing protein [Pyrinomonadaceae bacterium]
MSNNIIGISCFFHDAACCLLKDGVLIAAAEEERFSRSKHDASIPKRAFNYCLEEAGLTIDEVDCVAYYEEPTKKLARQISMMLPGLASEKKMMVRLDPHRAKREIREILGYEGLIEYVGHHQAHAASCFYYSGFNEAAILTVDGVGEWDTTSYGVGKGKDLEILETVEFPHSLGLLYSTITGYLGFEVNEGEYKVMGLAPYGQPRHADLIRKLIINQPRGQYLLDLQYFDFKSFQRMYSDKMLSLFGRPPRQPRTEILDFHKDLARSLQFVLEELLMDKLKYLHELTGSENLCMAGGVALNCVANGRIKREGPFKQMFVQPAAGDSGGALGAAAIAHQRRANGETKSLIFNHAYLGPAFTSEEVASLVESTGVKAQDFRGREVELIEAVAQKLAAGKIVGWFQGRMEFGPRALGARSILADPRGEKMQDRINSIIKQRESFRPFAPAVLEERAAAHFDLDHVSRYMLETCQVKSPIKLPAVTHVDGSARVQTVDEETNPRFARLLRAFERLTGCPILLNTSFNLNYEPIVCNPIDALICFILSGLDTLVLEDFIIDRSGISEMAELVLRRTAQTRPDAITYKTYTLF